MLHFSLQLQQIIFSCSSKKAELFSWIYAHLSTICVLTECPHVQQFQSQMEEMDMLLNVSRQQYNDRLLLVQRRTADTQRWLSNMDDEYSWVCRLSGRTVGPNGIFSVITVCL